MPSRLVSLIIIPLLIACSPKKPEISLPEIPARPLVQALEQRRSAFTGLKAVASVAIVRSGRTRAYDTVGIVIDGQRRLRVEAYGPLGQSLVTLVWNGAETVLRLEDGRVERPRPADLEQLLGIPMDGDELCAVLTGNIPAGALTAEGSAFRNPDGSTLVVLNGGGAEHRVSVVLPEAGLAQDARISASELYRSGRLAYRVRYEEAEKLSSYLIAKTIKIESPEHNTSLTIVYTDMDVNSPLPDDAFILPGGETGAPRP